MTWNETVDAAINRIKFTIFTLERYMCFEWDSEQKESHISIIRNYENIIKILEENKK
jgi:hypothetical protein